MSWTDERVAMLKQLWGEGKTAAEIAKLLGGVTRNAVIGKAHRLKLSGRVSPIQQNTRPETVLNRVSARVPGASSGHGATTATSLEARPQVRALARELETPMAPRIEEFKGGKGVKLVELRERMCRWPIGDPKDEGFSFCGCESHPDLPYCEYHAKVAYQINTRGKIKIDELAKIDTDVIRKTAAR